MTCRQARTVSAVLLLLAGGACRRAAPASVHPPVQLLGATPVAGDLLTSEVVLDGRDLRLDDPGTIAGIGFFGTEHRVTAEGLRLEPRTSDPFLLIDPGGRFNMLELEVQVDVDGYLEVFWSSGDQPFGEERKKTVWLSASPAFARYRVDLWADLDLREHGYRFRLDPVNQRAPVTIRSLAFRRVIYLPPARPFELPARGKVTLGGDTREAASLAAGQRLSTTVDIHEDDVLTFALAGLRDNDTPMLFQVVVEQGSKQARVAWEGLLPVPGPQSWTEHRVPLGRFAGPERHLVLTAREGARGPLGVAVALCAAPRVSGAGAPRPANLIVISLDTLGARHLSLYGGQRRTDRFLGRLASEGTLFLNAFATSSLTDTSHGSLLTGMAPFNSASFWLEGVPRSATTLAETLRQRGYATAGITGGVLVGRRQGFDRGFELFHEANTLFKPPRERTDVVEVLRRGEAWWAGASRPRFLFLHSYEAHGPYYWREGFLPRPPARAGDVRLDYCALRPMRGMTGISRSQIPDFVVALTPGGGEATLAAMGHRSFDVQAAELLYESEIAYLDEQLRLFWERLSRQGLLEDTVVVVTSDHGEAFFEHRLLEHGQLYSENLHVPLLLWAPGRVPQGTVVRDHVSTMDIVPTVLDLLGTTAEHRFDGRSVRRLLWQEGTVPGAHFYAFVRENGFAWHGEGFKYVLPAALVQENFGQAELFDLRTDPAETRDLLARGRAIPTSIVDEMARTIDSMPGLHVGLEEFAGGEYELQTSMVYTLFRLYGFHLDRLDAPRAAAEVYGLRARLKRGARLVALGGPGETPISFRLRPAGGGPVAEFVVDERALSERATRVTARGATKGLWVRKVTAGRGGPMSSRVSPEERERLRALGYAQ